MNMQLTIKFILLLHAIHKQMKKQKSKLSLPKDFSEVRVRVYSGHDEKKDEDIKR